MNRKRGYLYILLAAMIFSTTEVALKGLGGVFAPMQITVERVLIGALFLLPFALRSLRRNAIRLTRSDWSYFALLGFLTVTLHMSLLQMAVLHMDASATSIIYSGNPVFALAAAHLILHEPLKRNHLIAIGVELIGILFILNPAKLEVSPRGFAEILTATILFAMYGTLCKLRIPRLGGLVITTFNMVLGGLELLALLLLYVLLPSARSTAVSGWTFSPTCRSSPASRSGPRCCCATSASSAPPSAFCSPPRSRNTPPRPRLRSSTSSSPFWQRSWRWSASTRPSASTA